MNIFELEAINPASKELRHHCVTSVCVHKVHVSSVDGQFLVAHAQMSLNKQIATTIYIYIKTVSS